MSASASASKSLVLLPIVTIQPDFTTVISEVQAGLIPSESIWVSCYRSSCPSVHAKVNVVLDEVDRDAIVMEPKEGDVRVEHKGVS